MTTEPVKLRKCHYDDVRAEQIENVKIKTHTPTAKHAETHFDCKTDLILLHHKHQILKKIYNYDILSKV